jgi:hypothetical protein
LAEEVEAVVGRQLLMQVAADQKQEPVECFRGNVARVALGEVVVLMTVTVKAARASQAHSMRRSWSSADLEPPEVEGAGVFGQVSCCLAVIILCLWEELLA